MLNLEVLCICSIVLYVYCIMYSFDDCDDNSLFIYVYLNKLFSIYFDKNIELLSYILYN